MDLVRRSGWGARPPKGKPVPIATPVRYLFLHHSAGGTDNGAESVRDIQRFHQDTRGWADIAYTWVYSPRHRTFFEGRGPGIHGAHTRGYNKTGHAVCVLGNYELEPVPAHALDDLADWARWHGTAWGPNRYTPHSEMGATKCPGANLLAVLRDINLYAESDMSPSDSRATRDWITHRVEHRYGSYDAWEQAIEESGL